ncbi:hypothetical protein GCM10007173_25970 [Glutamicibacter ardleyensis]|uniref:IS30 family transposase n=1 Tax=Glutamicibacter ardleyensis TaxID=225894 RepID=A0ABQ2DPF2_9MICC|nr:hypothetical protein GCM10007173_25970 [Glutamicibacter ardleyensis]
MLETKDFENYYGTVFEGTELAQQWQITLATKMDTYFCDLHSPWRRRTSENTNGLLRQYFPKGTDLSVY